MINHNPYWIIKCTDIPLSLSFPRSFDHSGLFRVDFQFTSLRRISDFYQKLRRYLTLATPRVVSVSRGKVFVWRNVVPPASVTRVVSFPETGSRSWCEQLVDFAKKYISWKFPRSIEGTMAVTNWVQTSNLDLLFISNVSGSLYTLSRSRKWGSSQTEKIKKKMREQIANTLMKRACGKW